MDLSTWRAAFLTTVLLFSATHLWADAVVATVPTGVAPCAIAIDSVTNLTYVADSGSNSVIIINGLNMTNTVNVENRPSVIAMNPVTNTIYVGNDSTNTNGFYAYIMLINGSTNDTNGSYFVHILTSLYVTAMAVNSATNMIYLGWYGFINGTPVGPVITIINGSTNTLNAQVNVEGRPSGIAVNPVTNMIYVTYEGNNTGGSNTVTAINGSTDDTASIGVGAEAGGIAVNPVTNKIYTSNTDGAMTVIDGATNDTSTISVGVALQEMAVNSVTNKIYGISSSTVTVINGATNTISTVGNAGGGNAVAVNSLTNMIYVANKGSNIVTVINGSLPFVPNTPTAPMLFSPSNGALNQATTLALNWNMVSGAASYAVQLSTVSSFSTTVSNQTGLTAGTSQAISLSQNKIYYWKANATNLGGTSTWSSIWSFTTNNLPNVPVLAFPTNGAIGIPLTTTLSWSSVLNATSYTLQLSNTTSFTFVTDTTLKTAFKILTTSSENALYYWEVYSTSSGGNSAWSSIWRFTVSPTSMLPSDHFTIEPSFTINNGMVSYTLNEQSPVEFKIYDIIGRKLFQVSRVQPSGNYSFSIKRLNLPSALYIVQFKAGNIERQATIMAK